MLTFTGAQLAQINLHVRVRLGPYLDDPCDEHACELLSCARAHWRELGVPPMLAECMRDVDPERDAPDTLRLLARALVRCLWAATGGAS